MSSNNPWDNYRRLFLDDVPMMDVRAPVEYAKGAFPHTVNLPLMSDEERHQVGICYKLNGQDAAIELGHRLVNGAVKEARVAAWVDFARQNPQGCLYCFRGGLRSRVTQQWLQEAGVDLPFVRGGYKAMRRFLIDTLERAIAEREFVILGGRTGCGKTKVVLATPASVDLEGAANHRGSSFGRRATPQPSQIDFENRVAVALLKLEDQQPGALMLEDEGRIIGSCHLPPALYEKMGHSPLVLVEEEMEERIDCVFEDYVEGLLGEYQTLYAEAGFSHYRGYMLGSLDRIRKRLGGERHQAVRTLMSDALDAHEARGETRLHREWIRVLLGQYYDPMYDYQLSNKLERVRFRGNRQEVLAWFEDYRAAGAG